jgi:hypothetical protein
MTEIAKQFGLANELPLFPRYNIAPTQSVPVVLGLRNKLPINLSNER